MSVIIWLVAGALFGWIASMVMRTDVQPGALLTVGAGVFGSALGAWFIAPMMGGATVNPYHFSATGLMSSLLGAVILLAIVNIFGRRRLR